MNERLREKQITIANTEHVDLMYVVTKEEKLQ